MKPGPGKRFNRNLRILPVQRIATFVMLGLALVSFLLPATPAQAGVIARMENGILMISLNDPEKLTIGCQGTRVVVTGLTETTQLGLCSTLLGVSIHGSPGGDWIDLRSILRPSFALLGFLEVQAGAGNDLINASGFSDRLDGGPGDDTYIGASSDDIIDTSLGQDYFLEETQPLGKSTKEEKAAEANAPQEPDAPPLEGSFEAINYNSDAALTGYYQIPPDPIGASGPAHVLSVVNSSIQWFTKNGVLQNSQRLGNNGSVTGSFFEPLSPVNLLFDPKAIYDQYAGRFLVVALEQRDTADGDPVNSSRILLAVSDDSDPNGAWYYHAINSLVNFSGTDAWADYPGFAIDGKAVYITNNMFSFGANIYQGALLWIVDKDPFYSGGAASVTVHNPPAAVGQAATTAQPTHLFGSAPAGVGTWLVRYSGFSGGGSEFLSIIRVDDPLGAPAFSHQFVSMGNIDNTGLGFVGAPQLGTSALIETNDRRALHAVWRDNSLWATFEIRPGGGPPDGEITAHWARVNTSDLAALALSDQGNAGGEDIAADTYTYFPSIAVDPCGNMALGFAASASTIYPGAYYTLRYASDPAGTVQASETLAAGVDYYLRTFGGTRNRWGDYSGIALDPASEAAFWVYNEYSLARGNVDGNGHDGRWGTRWGAFASGIDFGDLPAAYNQTIFAEDGARHCLSALRLGAGVGPDPDGQESVDALADNDDGVSPTGNWSDDSGNIQVTVTGGRACLSAWLDYWNGGVFGADNDFSDSGEQIFDRQALYTGSTSLSFSLPSGAANDGVTFYGRFRLAPDQDADGDCSDQAAISATGLVSGGEVEDYEFNFHPTAVRISSLQAQPANRSLLVPAIGIAGLICLAGVLLTRRRLPLPRD